MKKFRLAIIGLGGRGEGLYRCALKYRNDVEYVALCDEYADRCEYVANEMKNDGHAYPKLYSDYKKCVDENELDAVVIATAWEAHIKISLYCLERGIAVACEVGGGYSLDQLWSLVRCQERTQTPFMMLENCCYGRIELLALNMKRKGVLGEIVHCEGGYRHDLREEVTSGKEKRHYRLQQYIHRNCENYPTHEIGPIAKLLDVNCGNRFLSLVSCGSKSVGLEKYVEQKNIEHLKGVKFNQSDVVTTTIKCANGELINITLDTCLPRYYSRGFMVHGTKGLICEENKSVYLDDEFTEECWDWKDNFNNIGKYYERYEHPYWKNFDSSGIGHGGMDYQVFDGFFNALKDGAPMPIDVYDFATYACISVLSEQSLATGLPVAFPDFTDGKWILRQNDFADVKDDESAKADKKEG